jgi:hypothetical protein
VVSPEIKVMCDTIAAIEVSKIPTFLTQPTHRELNLPDEFLKACIIPEITLINTHPKLLAVTLKQKHNPFSENLHYHSLASNSTGRILEF